MKVQGINSLEKISRKAVQRFNRRTVNAQQWNEQIDIKRVSSTEIANTFRKVAENTDNAAKALQFRVNTII